MSNENLDDIIKQRSQDHEAQVPPDAWDNIINKKKRKPYPFFWWLSILLIGLIVTGVFYFNKSNSVSNKNTASNTQKKENSTNNNNNQNISTTNPFSITNNTKTDSTQTKNLITNSIRKPDHQTTNFTNIENTSTKTSNFPNNFIATTINPKGNSKNSKRSTKQKIRSVITGGETDEIAYEQKNTASFYTERNKKSKTKSKIISPDVNEIKTGTNEESTTAPEENSITTTTKTIQPPIENIEGPIEQLTKTKDSSLTTAGKDSGNLVKNTNSNKKEKSNNKSHKNQWWLDVSVIPFSPSQAYDQPLYLKRYLTNSDGSTSTLTTNSFKSTLQFSFGFQALVRKNISNKLNIGLGVYYSTIKEDNTLSGTDTTVSYNTIQRLVNDNVNPPYLRNDTVSSISTGLRTIHATNTYTLFSIPLLLQYNFISTPKISVGLNGGIYFNVSTQYTNVIKGNIEAQYPDGTQPANSNNRSSIDYFASLRITKPFGKKLSLFAEPVYRINGDKLKVKNTFVNKKIDQVGIGIGLTYKIK
ncbi:hypothetical protein [Ferruginibacter albus]|uniref:hypothetical protein n=1 Tax=Ferruginibacter albus TaxID=2875540 RepID=UPI001CC6A715|nr:hypothetical protein [Ferruginibacter albus]UAY51447.1 hypothetical protein K9M53_12720 [Ferruginibacter albus]